MEFLQAFWIYVSLWAPPAKKKKMQLDVGMEPTFRFEHIICICKEMGIVKYFTRYELLSSLIFVTDRQTDRQTDGQTDGSDAYEPTVQFAQVGSKIIGGYPLY